MNDLQNFIIVLNDLTELIDFSHGFMISYREYLLSGFT